MPSSFSDVLVFGDSISDTGNAFLLTGGAAAAPPYFEGRFSNGPVWVEDLADGLGLPAPAPSLVGGTNYAFGGAETGGGLSLYGTPNVGLQIQMALADRGGFTSDELIVVAAGSNDLAALPPSGPAGVVRNLADDISALAAGGGRTFLVPNLPSPGQNPANRGTSKEVYFDTLTTEVNRLLEQRLPKLEDDLGITIVRFDMDGVVDTMLHSPTDFGLTNVTDPACPGCGVGFPAPDAADTIVPNPDEYLCWDFVHMSRVAHAAIGEAATEVVQGEARMLPGVSSTLEPLAKRATRSSPTGTDSLTLELVNSRFTEASQRWQTAGVGTSTLGCLDLRIANRGGATLGLASGDLIRAAGWGWFVDPTPGGDSEFTTPGNQGEQHRMDLLTVLEHEIGHVLGREHEADGLVAETLPAGTRLAVNGGGDAATSSFAPDALFALLATDEATAWSGSTIVGKGRGKQ